MSRKTKNIIILIFLFIGSRLFFYIIGIRFDITPLTWYFQYLDPVDLKTNLLQSLFYLHSQPPGFNLFLGLILKWASGFETTAFQVIYILIGLIITIALYKMLIEFKISSTVALLFSMFCALSPPVILYENWLFYTYPVVCLLLLSILFLNKYLKKNQPVYLFLFFSALGLIVITRTLFQPIWFLTILILMIILDKKNIGKILLAALLPLMMILTLCIKNYVVFREANLSSWFGMNLIKMTFSIPYNQIMPLIEKGTVSDIAIKKPFQAPDAYQTYAKFDTVTNIPVLDKQYKSTGAVNFNHLGYIAVSRKYYAAACYLIKKFPFYYLHSIIKAFYTYLRPCSSFQEADNTKKIAFWKNIYEEYLCGDVLQHVWNINYVTRFDQVRKIHLNFLYLFIPFLYCWATILAIKGQNFLDLSRAEMLVIRYIVFNIIYITLIGNLIEVGENMRFRFLILPSLYILVALFLRYLMTRKT